ncbi:MAG: signal recognition particle-docking protein FtsY [Clostridiaceae bacterium]|jgi:fused signal recognition particle receptor|nr:signal recognition particle-docking protein FtsY [Clostridiaceae bacterium]
MSLLNKFKDGLSKTRQFVTESFNRVAASFGIFDEDFLDELEMILIQADCGIEVSTKLVESIRDKIRADGKVDREHVLSTLRQDMLDILQTKAFTPDFSSLNVVFMVGVNGTGKTTTAGKIAYQFQKQGIKTMLAAADTFRAAAIDQLKIWGERANVPVISNTLGTDPASVVYDAMQSAKARDVKLLIIDTAGRLHNKPNLMSEMEKMHRVAAREGQEVSAIIQNLLVLDATTGQNAVVQARAFNESVALDGLIITKLDGSAKGGVALAVADEMSLPLLYAGLGEGIDDLADFDAELFVESLLPEE